MADIKGSRTERNLLAAFAGECQASVRYAFYAKKAKKDGYEQICAVFQETSEQERAHARRMYKLMGGLAAEVAMPLHAHDVGTTLENLTLAVAGETRVGYETYPAYAAEARAEGFAEAALVFENIAKAEQFHCARYKALAENIESGRVFAREEPVTWICRHCAWTYVGKNAPERCPACDHPKAHFEVARSGW
ncbi:rubrerythrin [Fundidesulfovibrio terrae]|uniref:rubrerythrin n=1 Tax=Fundidesulfovibrio terrae TaxID=2922866 RepID=UPI001FAE7E8D|nr:ferritin family protein [Fundidesulfovibrio terrae]